MEDDMLDNSTVHAQVNVILESVTKQMESYILYTKILGIIELILQKFEGKRITKRIETAIQEALPSYTLYYGHPYLWYTLQVWDKNITFDQRMNLNLGYNDTFSMEEFKKNNTSYYLDADRHTQLKKYIDNPSILEVMIQNKNFIKEEIKKYNSLIPDEYSISKYLKL